MPLDPYSGTGLMAHQSSSACFGEHGVPQAVDTSVRNRVKPMMLLKLCTVCMPYAALRINSTVHIMKHTTSG